MRRIGLISDTHGLLRPEAIAYLSGSDTIIHAGDIGDAAILDALNAIAPVVAVRGNNDRDAWAADLPHMAELKAEGVVVRIIHDAAELTPGAVAGARVVVHGHSHKPHIEDRDGVLYVNPGSAGRRRFKLPIAAGELRVADGVVTAHVAILVET